MIEKYKYCILLLSIVNVLTEDISKDSFSTWICHIMPLHFTSKFLVKYMYQREGHTWKYTCTKGTEGEGHTCTKGNKGERHIWRYACTKRTKGEGIWMDTCTKGTEGEGHTWKYTCSKGTKRKGIHESIHVPKGLKGRAYMYQRE